MQDRTKQPVIQILKRIDKKCIVMFGLKEKKNLIKFVRDMGEKELAIRIVKEVQDAGRGLE